MNGFFAGRRVNSGGEPIGVASNEIALQFLQIAAVTELNMVGFLHGVVPKEEVGEFPGVVGALVDVACEGGVDGLPAVFHRLTLAHFVNAQILIGVRAGSSICQRGRDLIALEFKGLRTADIPAVKPHVARLRVDVDGFLSVDVAADVRFQCFRTRFCCFIAHDRGTFLIPISVILIVQNDSEQASVGRSVFPGDSGENAAELLAGARLSAAGREGQAAQHQKCNDSFCSHGIEYLLFVVRFN